MDGITMILLALIYNIDTERSRGKVTIPKHRGDIKKGTLNAILKQVGIKEVKQ
jgi:hypothetical protein